MRRTGEQEVKLLVNLLPFVKTGELLGGESNLQVFRIDWPMSSAQSCSRAAPRGSSSAPSSLRSRPPRGALRRCGAARRRPAGGSDPRRRRVDEALALLSLSASRARFG